MVPNTLQTAFKWSRPETGYVWLEPGQAMYVQDGQPRPIDEPHLTDGIDRPRHVVEDAADAIRARKEFANGGPARLTEHGVRLHGRARPDVDRWYEPFAEPRPIFQVFARLAPTLKEIKWFADNFGSLGSVVEKDVFFTTNPDDFGDSARGQSIAAAYAEPLSEWTRQIRFVRDTIGLWEAIRANDGNAIAEYIEQIPRTTATAVLTNTINRFLRAYCSPVLTLKISAEDARAAVSELKRVRSASPLARRVQAAPLLPEIAIEPHSLIGAIWLQLALAINGNKYYRNCKRCGTPFEVRLKAQHQEFCSAACKQKDFRERHK